MMAKRKSAPRKSPTAAKLKSTAELTRDTANPRKITKKAASGLSKSLERFGDLSGIVFNLRTGELVAGHQRMNQIKERWGEREIVLIDTKTNLYGIRIDDDHFFPVRVVDWSKAKQRAANVAANNAKIAGEFTDELSSYLLEVHDDLESEMPSVLEDVLIDELIGTDDGADGGLTDEDYSMRFQVVVELEHEDGQVALLKRLKEEGYSVRALVS